MLPFQDKATRVFSGIHLALLVNNKIKFESKEKVRTRTGCCSDVRSEPLGSTLAEVFGAVRIWLVNMRMCCRAAFRRGFRAEGQGLGRSKAATELPGPCG